MILKPIPHPFHKRAFIDGLRMLLHIFETVPSRDGIRECCFGGLSVRQFYLEMNKLTHRSAQVLEW